MDGEDDECSWPSARVKCDDFGNITYINIDADLVGGKVPRDVALLSDSLEMLHFCCVEFKGSIPTELGLLSKLRRLRLWANELNGTIPTELGGLTSIQILGLRDNKLSGTIPTELGVLNNLGKSFLVKCSPWNGQSF